jgi:hypothetical protein
MKFKKYLTEATKTLNVAVVPLDKAIRYSQDIVSKSKKDMDLNKFLPDFEKNYSRLQKMYKAALDVKRINMPVIEPDDIKKFEERLNKGQVDIFRPFALKKAVFPKKFTQKLKGEQWVKLGEKDGNPNDDKVDAKIEKVPAKNLMPIQSQLWLEKLIGSMIKFGRPKQGSPITDTTIIASKEGYILDGHHRHGQAMLYDPDLKMKVLRVPLDVKTLLKMGRSYGTAIGNRQKA